MRKYNQSRGFKQAGFTYPGVSPLQGKRKEADKLAASEDLADAKAKISEFGKMKMESADLISDKSFSITAAKNPITQKVDEPSTDSKISSDDVEETFQRSFKNAAGSEIGKTVGNALATSGINAIVGRIARPRKTKKPRKGPDVSGFSNIKFGRS